MKRTSVVLVSLLAAPALILVACGDDDDTTTQTEATAETTVEATEAPAESEPIEESAPADTTADATAQTEPTEAPAEPEPIEESVPADTAAESEVAITVSEPPQQDGTFVASGSAVDEGAVCTEGTTTTTSVTDDQGQPPPWTPEPENLLVEMQFTCDDGSGRFTVQIAQPAYGEEDFAAAAAGDVMGAGEETWVVLSGTDSYTTLSGEGTRSWQQIEPELIETVYEGTLSG